MVRPDDTVEHTIDSRLVIVISNGSLRTKPKNKCIIQPIAASEASAKGKVYQKRKRKQPVKVKAKPGEKCDTL